MDWRRRSRLGHSACSPAGERSGSAGPWWEHRHGTGAEGASGAGGNRAKQHRKPAHQIRLSQDLRAAYDIRALVLELREDKQAVSRRRLPQGAI
jgi:hypothetical protein